MEQNSPAVLGPVEPSVRPHALAYARARVSMLGAAEDMDTVSGEPQNWWCDEAGTATVEDGSIAAMVLRGELTGAQVRALE